MFDLLKCFIESILCMTGGRSFYMVNDYDVFFLTRFDGAEQANKTNLCASVICQLPLLLFVRYRADGLLLPV